MSLMDDLRTLSSADEFFAYFEIDVDPAVVNVSRLHILKRFNQYLARAGDAAVTREACRDLLEQAYQDFVDSRGVDEKVFRVFHLQGPQPVRFHASRTARATH